MSVTEPHHRKTLWKALALLAAAATGVWLLMLGPATADDPVPQARPAGEGEIVATFAGEAITLADLEERLAPQLVKIDQERHAVLEQGLEQLIRQRLLETEAEERGVEPSELIQSEVTAKVAAMEPPSNAEVDAFYEENKQRINQPKEQIAEQIRQYLVQQRSQEAIDGFYDTLREKYGVEELLAPLEPVRLPIETAGFPVKGPEDAVVTLVEFSDFQCPYCARVLPTVEQVHETYGDQVRVIFRQFPLRSIHPQAQKAAEASLCAEDQGKFWELHDAMFADQSKLSVADLKETATKVGIEAEPFNQCLDSGEYAEAVQADLEAGSALGVTGTPALFVNGRPLPGGAVPFEQVAELIDEELERAGASKGAATDS